MRIPLSVLLLIVTVGCMGLGVYLNANLWEVALGLALGGGVSGGLLFLIRLVQDKQSPSE